MATHSSIPEQRSLAGYSPWGHKESDTTEHTSTYIYYIYIYIIYICTYKYIHVFGSSKISCFFPRATD